MPESCGMDNTGGTSTLHEGPVRELRAEPLGSSTRVTLIVYAIVEATLLLSVSLISIFVPALRFVAVPWVVILVVVLAFGVPKLRRISRGQREYASLILDGSYLRYTDWQGKQVSCRRSEVRSAVLLLITISRKARDVIVFQDAGQAPLISIPSGLFNADAVDELIADLRIGSLHRHFVNSKRELDAVSPGLQIPGFDLSGKALIDRSPAYRRLVLGFLIAVVVFLVVFVVVASRS